MERSFLAGREEFRRHGRRWWLDPRQSIDRAIITGEWEPTSTAAVRRLVQPGMVACDIGANIGWYTVLLSDLVGPEGKVFAFEPMDEPRAVIAQHVEMNGLRNVEVSGVALSNTSESCPNGSFAYSWPDPSDPVERRANPIRVDTLDVIAADWPRLDFIKIDVDGFEAKILQGARATLARLRPTLLLEVCDYALMRAAENPSRPSVVVLPQRERIDHTRYNYGTYTEAMLGDLVKLGYSFLWEDTFEPVLAIEHTLTCVDLSERSFNLVVVPQRGR